MRLSDTPALRKIDQAYHAPFLTACTAALAAHGYLTDAEAEQLRLQLKERHKVETDETLFEELLQQNSTMLATLRARLGTRNINRLLFRWTAAKALENFNFGIWSFAQELLAKAELMFNQPFIIYSGRVAAQKSPFSFFLVETAGVLHKNADELHAIVQQLKQWSQRKVDPESFEASLVSHLGFTLDDDLGLADWKLHELLKKTWLQLELLQEFTAHLLAQLRPNLKLEKEEPRLAFLLEDIHNVLQGARGLSQVDFNAQDVMDGKRVRTLSVIQDCKELFFEFYRLTIDSLKSSRIPTEAPLVWPEDESRAIINHLLDRGVGINEAQQALKSLIRYCQDHAVSPDQLLEAELQKIHPSFDNTSSLFLKKAGASDRLSEAFNDEKHQIVHKKELLMQHVNQRLLGITVVLLLLLPFAAACGVKTAPRSVTLDPRPEVPYHVEQRQPAKKKAEAPAAPPASTAPSNNAAQPRSAP